MARGAQKSPWALALLASALMHAGFFVLPDTRSSDLSKTGIGPHRQPSPHRGSFTIPVLMPDWAESNDAHEAPAAGGDSGAVSASISAGELLLAPSLSERPLVFAELGHLPEGGLETVFPEVVFSHRGGLGHSTSSLGSFGTLGRAEGSGGVAGPDLTPPPRYPPRAREEGREGEVQLEVRIGRGGIPASVGILRSSGHPDLDQSAKQTVAAVWRFPGLRERELTKVLIRFELERREGSVSKDF